MTHQQESGMQPKPELYSSHYAEWFKDSDVIAAYPSRPPYARYCHRVSQRTANQVPVQRVRLKHAPLRTVDRALSVRSFSI